MFNSADIYFRIAHKCESLYLSSGPAQGLVSASWQRVTSTNGEERVRGCKESKIKETQEV